MGYTVIPLERIYDDPRDKDKSLFTELEPMECSLKSSTSLEYDRKQQLALKVIEENPGISAMDINQSVGYKRMSSMHAMLARLMDEGAIMRTGKRRLHKYYIKKR